jgi:hypothetical protein
MGLWSGWMAPRMQQKAMVKLPLEELAGEALAGEECSPLEGGAVEGSRSTARRMARWRGAARWSSGGKARWSLGACSRARRRSGRDVPARV